MSLMCLLVACGPEPLNSAGLLKAPDPKALAGTYVPDASSVSALMARLGSSLPPEITLRADGRITITGHEFLGLTDIGGEAITGATFEERWVTGRVDDHVVIQAGELELLIVRDHPPYALELMISKPGWQRVLRFERK